MPGSELVAGLEHLPQPAVALLEEMVGGQTVVYRADDLTPMQKQVLDSYARIIYGAC